MRLGFNSASQFSRFLFLLDALRDFGRIPGGSGSKVKKRVDQMASHDLYVLRDACLQCSDFIRDVLSETKLQMSFNPDTTHPNG